MLTYGVKSGVELWGPNCCTRKNCCGVLGSMGILNGLLVAPGTGIQGPDRFVADNKSPPLDHAKVRFVAPPESTGASNTGGGTTVTVATRLVAVLRAPATRTKNCAPLSGTPKAGVA